MCNFANLQVFSVLAEITKNPITFLSHILVHLLTVFLTPSVSRLIDIRIDISGH